ncbi:MAG: hypothetical protein AAFQ35_08065 [Pseudomonadota bacterium]
MTYATIVTIGQIGFTIAQVLLVAAIAVGLIGIVRPSWVRLSSRWRVIGATFALLLVGAAIFVGTFVWTHSQENGPHSAETYLRVLRAEACIETPGRDFCSEVRSRCETEDASHPACRVLRGERP